MNRRTGWSRLTVLPAVLGAALLVAGAAPAVAGPWPGSIGAATLDANNPTPEMSSAIGVQIHQAAAVAQVFTAEHTGTVVSAQVYYQFVPVYPDPSLDMRLQFRVASVDESGVPSEVLTSAADTLPVVSTHSQPGMIGLAAVDFAVPVAVTSGKQYALIVGSNVTGGVGSGVLFVTTTPDAPYRAGTMFINEGGRWVADPESAQSADFAVYVVPNTP